MAIILQLQCFKTTNSDECFDQTQQSLCTLQSILLWVSPHPRPHPNLTLLLPEVEASSTEHSLFFFFQMSGILLCFSVLPKMPLNPLTILHLIYYNLTSYECVLQYSFLWAIISYPIHPVPINSLTSFTSLLDHLSLLVFLCQTPPSLLRQNNFFLLSISHQTSFLFSLFMQHISKTTHARASPGCLAHAFVYLGAVLHSLSVCVELLSLYASPPHGSVCLPAEWISTTSVSILTLTYIRNIFLTKCY